LFLNSEIAPSNSDYLVEFGNTTAAGVDGHFSRTFIAPQHNGSLELEANVIDIPGLGIDGTGVLFSNITINVDPDPPVLIGFPTLSGLQIVQDNRLLEFFYEESGSGIGETILRFWVEGRDDMNKDGVADENEFKSQILNKAGPGHLTAFMNDTINFHGQQVVAYANAWDRAGNFIVSEPGAPLSPASSLNWTTRVPTETTIGSVEMASAFLNPGVTSDLTTVIYDANGFNDVISMTLNLSDGLVINSDGANFSTNSRHIELRDSWVEFLNEDHSAVKVHWKFRLNWTWALEDLTGSKIAWISAKSFDGTITNKSFSPGWEFETELALFANLLDNTGPIKGPAETVTVAGSDVLALQGIIQFSQSKAVPDLIKLLIEGREFVVEGGVLDLEIPLNSLSSGTHQVTVKIEEGAFLTTVHSWTIQIDAMEPTVNVTGISSNLSIGSIGDINLQILLQEDLKLIQPPRLYWELIRGIPTLATANELLDIRLQGGGEATVSVALDLSPFGPEEGDILNLWITGEDAAGNKIRGGDTEMPLISSAIVDDLADLVPISMSVSATQVEEGQLITLRTTVSNQGQPLSEDFAVDLYLGNTSVPFASTNLSFRENRFIAVGVFEWSAESGAFTILIEVDPLNRIQEVDESNNLLTQRLLVGGEGKGLASATTTTISMGFMITMVLAGIFLLRRGSLKTYFTSYTSESRATTGTKTTTTKGRRGPSPAGFYLEPDEYTFTNLDPEAPVPETNWNGGFYVAADDDVGWFQFDGPPNTSS